MCHIIVLPHCIHPHLVLYNAWVSGLCKYLMEVHTCSKTFTKNCPYYAECIQLEFHKFFYMFYQRVYLEKFRRVLCNDFSFRKPPNKRNPILIHLNLCISLALGIIVFVSGIETAVDNEV